MKKYIGIVPVMALIAGTVFAQSQNASVRWSCDVNSGVRYCGTDITSGTTSVDLGSVDIAPNRIATVVATANQSALSGLVTPTLTLRLGGAVVGTQSISATTVGNATAFTVPFDNVAVSFSTPSTISATNSVRMTVIGR